MKDGMPSIFWLRNVNILAGNLVFMKPWGVEIYGGPVSIGDYTTLIATMDKTHQAYSLDGEWKVGKS